MEQATSENEAPVAAPAAAPASEEKSEKLKSTGDLERIAKESAGKPVNVQLLLLQGIFGEVENCNGIGEDIIDTDEKFRKYGLDPTIGGTFLKIMGCNLIYEGWPQQDKVYALEQAKDNLMNIPRNIIARSFLLSSAVVLLFLFNRRRFYFFGNNYMGSIMHKTVRHQHIPDIRYVGVAREIKRAMEAAIRNTFWIKSDQRFPTFAHPEGTFEFGGKPNPLDLAGFIIKLTLFLCVIIDKDCAYRFPVKDIFSEMDPVAAKKDGVKEFLRIVSIFAHRSRGSSGHSLGDRIIFLRLVIRIFLFLSPKSRAVIREFMANVDKEKCELTKEDYYFTLRRNSYNFQGKTFTERMKELPEWDREYKNQYVKIEFRQRAPQDQSGIKPAQ